MKFKGKSAMRKTESCLLLFTQKASPRTDYINFTVNVEKILVVI